MIISNEGENGKKKTIRNFIIGPYKDVVNTDRNFGNDDSYRNGFNNFAEKNCQPHYDYMCELINDK